MSAVINTFALLITLPLLGFLIVYYISKLFLTKRKAVKLSIDTGTLLLILLAEVLMTYIWGDSHFGIVALMICVAALVYTIIFWKVKDDIVPRKLIKGIWRFNFLLFLAVDFCLIVYGIIDEIIKQT